MNIRSKLYCFLVIFCAILPVNLFAADSGNPAALYQLINEFRLHPHSCENMGASSSHALKKNPLLEKAAGIRAEGLPLSESLNEAGIGAPYANVLVVGGANIMQVMERIIQRHCTDIADSNYAEVGAVWKKNRWWIVLAYQTGDDVINVPVASMGTSSKKNAGSEASTDHKKYLELVNQARAESRMCGNKQYDAAQPLVWNSMLALAAQKHGLDMAANSKMSHEGSDGSQAWDRVKKEGYDYSTLAENVAMNPMGMKSTVESWLDSPSHCANIMNSDFTEFGAAFAAPYSVMVLGRR